MRTTRSRTDSPPRGMEAIGLNIGETNKRNLAERRIKKGECPTCGMRTYKIGMFGKKTPLTVEGECVSGRCLRCKPLEGYLVRPPRAQPVFHQSSQEPVGLGSDIIVDDDDSIMSGITMDPALRSSSTRFQPGGAFGTMAGVAEEGEDFIAAFPPPPRMLRRPEPSLGGDSDFHPFPNRLEQPGPQQPATQKPAAPQPDDWMDSIGKLNPPQELGAEQARSRRQPHSSFTSSGRRSQRQRDTSPPMPSTGRPPEVPKRRPSPHRNSIAPLRLPSEIEEETSDQKLSSVSSGPRDSGSSDPPYPVPVTDSTEEKAGPLNKNYVPRDLQYYDDEEEKNEIQAPGYFSGDPWPDEDPNIMLNASRNSRKERRHPRPKQQSEISFVPDSPPRQMDGHGPRRQRSPPRHPPHGQRRISPPRDDLQFIPDSADHAANQRHPPARRRPQQTPITHPKVQSATRLRQRMSARDMDEPPPFDASGSGITNIPGIIRQLVSRDSNAKIRGEAFRSLADLIWSNGDEAKLMVQHNHGMDSVVGSMWEDLGNPKVQTAAVDLLFALSACSEKDMGRDIFMGGSAGKAIDALLISMQTHISVESLQRSGCGALGCLASASKENKQVDDGTLSGAVSCVVAAMDAHRKSTEVQKWGLWALHSQCVLSHNAENSQMSLAKGATEAGGINVVYRAMNVNEDNMMALQWGCKLFWSLSFSDEICGMLTETNRAIVVITKVLRLYQGSREAATVEEAAYGALANMSRVKKTHNWLRESQIVGRIVESMETYHSAVGLNVEVCALLANIVESRPLKEAVLTYGVDKIFLAMASFPDSVELNQEAMRALLCLSVDSDDSKARLATEENANLIFDAMARHHRSPLLQETGFAVLASLCVGKSAESVDLSDVFDLLIEAMQEFPTERKLQEAISLFLRNISCRERELVIESADFFHSLLTVMKAQADSDVVQRNMCCVLSNLLSQEQGIICSTIDDGMNQIVAVIQTHMESAPVLEMACAALWHLISSSEECKRSFVETGGVEYVKTALLMHPDSSGALEMACGVLSCLSGSPSHAKLVAEDQGLSYVVETMRNHSTSPTLLEYASVILRNAVLNNVANASEASGGISTIVAALRETRGESGFLNEACRTLWVMSAQSEDCRQKILALDGYAVLLDLMNNGGVEADVREAADGALNQLMIQCETE